MMLLIALLASSANLSHADNFVGEVFPPDSHEGKPLFTVQMKETPPGGNDRIEEALYKTPEGEVTVRELLEIKDGKLKKYSIDYPLSHQSGMVEVSGEKLLFSYTENGKTKTDDEKLRENSVVPATTLLYLRKNWETLLKGDDVVVRFASLGRLETIGFKFFKIGEEKRNGHDVIILKMKPTSIFISAIVKPLIFVLDKNTKRIIEYVGRILPKKFVDGKWKELDGRITYQYQ
jgi:hypothetical protein